MFFYNKMLLYFVLFICSFTFHSNATKSNEIIAKFRLRGDQQQEVIVRQMRDEDISESAAIIREAYLEDCLHIEHATKEQCLQMTNVPLERTITALRNFKNEKDSVLFVAERVTTGRTTSTAEENSNGSRLAGCIRVKLNPDGNTKDNGPYGQIGPFATRVGLQGSGIGMQMINAAEQYAIAQWNVCEMQLDAHGIPEPVPNAPLPSRPIPLLQFYMNRKYRRIGKTCWFNPANANYVLIPDPLCHLERVVKDLCDAPETDQNLSSRKRKEQKGTSNKERDTKRKRMHQHNSTEPVRNYALDRAINEDALNELVDAAVDWAHEVGLIKRLADDDSRKRRTSDLASIQPISLFPSPFPRSVYQQAVDVHTALQKLYFRVSCDYEFLKKASEKMVKTNELYGRMGKIMEEIQREGQRQPYTLFTTRSDYMADSTTDEQSGQQQFGLKQIEMNIGSVVGATMGPRTAEMHRRILQKMGMDASNVPENRAYNTLARGLYHGWLRFGDPDAVIVFAVLQGSVHRFDERGIEYELQRISDGQVQVVRMSSKEAYSKLHLDEEFNLRLSDDRRVALVYSRSGPLPEWTDEEWEARRTIERSTAIKTSTMFSALSSSKRVQQLLAQPGMIERFLPDEDTTTVEAIRRTFVGLWGLDGEDEQTRQLVQHAIDNPHLYVLKPQNEGGSHNYFDEELREKLQQFTQEERAAHTLMQRIYPMTVKNYLVRPMEEPVLDDVNVELGIFGYLLGDKRDQSIVHNHQHGFLVRTKPASSAEGGITAGGVYDSLNLF